MTIKDRRIIVEKNDEVASVIEKMMDAGRGTIVLEVRKGGVIVQQPNNFHIIKKQADILGQTIHIESVDDAVTNIGEHYGFVVSNPFFDNRPSKTVTDIIRAPRVEKKAEVIPVMQQEEVQYVIPEKKEPEQIKEEVVEREDRDEEMIPEEVTSRKSFSIAQKVFILLGIIGAGALTVVGVVVLPKAEVRLSTQKKNFTYTSAIVVDKTIRVGDVSAMKIPGQIFIEKRNVTLTFPASGKKTIEQKARGKVTLYNAYSSEKQTFVAKTRLATADGHLVRLEEAVVVPGAKILEGKVVPSSIDVDVIANEAGAASNIAPTPHLAIPGLKGTPKYDGFYGELKTAMSGGFVGERAYPTDEDVRKGKLAAETSVRDGAKNVLTQKIPSEFKVLEGSEEFHIVKQIVNTDANADGQFSIFTEGEIAVMAFQEKELHQLLTDRMAKDVGVNYAVKSKELKYGKGRFDSSVGRLTFPIDFKSILAPILKIGELKEKIKSKSEPELKALLFGMPGLESATISLWPFWVRSVPGNDEKISVIVD